MWSNVKIFIILLSFIVALWFGGALLGNLKQKSNLLPVSIGSTIVFSEIADTDALRETGLSGKISLAYGRGMLFVFEQPGFYQFWMKDMNFPIDIIWIGDDKRVVSVTPNATPESYPETFMPAAPVRYVLEVPAGFSEKNNVRPGEQTSFSI